MIEINYCNIDRLYYAYYQGKTIAYAETRGDLDFKIYGYLKNISCTGAGK